MKLIYAVLLLLVVTDVVSAKIEKSSERFFYCLSADAKTVRVDSAGAKEIMSSCKDVSKTTQKECLDKANSTFCKGLKSDVPLYGKLSEVPNKSTCAEFANKVLRNRNLGSLSKPAPSIATVVAVSNSESGQPNFQFNINGSAKTAIYAASRVDKATKKETWRLTVLGNSKVPSFEHNKDLGTVDNEAGEYRRDYNFNVVNNVCVLESIKVEFQPLAPKGQEKVPKYQMETSNLDQKGCDYSAQAFRGENYKKQFGRTLPRDLLHIWVCNESVTAFNPPETSGQTKDTRTEHTNATQNR